jgi:hypothetical protein
VAYGVSKILKQGANVLGAHVGNGFYSGDQGNDRFFWPRYEDNTFIKYGNQLCFFAELHLFYGDGTCDSITTGPDWNVRKSATTLANIYSSETKDFRTYPIGWDTSEYRGDENTSENQEDHLWKNATPVTGPRGKLKYQIQPPVMLHKTYQPKSSSTLEPGVVISISAKI